MDVVELLAFAACTVDAEPVDDTLCRPAPDRMVQGLARSTWSARTVPAPGVLPPGMDAPFVPRPGIDRSCWQEKSVRDRDRQGALVRTCAQTIW